MPEPDRRCMIKPSPPKKPLPIFLLKWTDRFTPVSAARKAAFCRMTSRPGWMVRGRMRPGKLEPKVIIPAPWAV